MFCYFFYDYDITTGNHSHQKEYKHSVSFLFQLCQHCTFLTLFPIQRCGRPIPAWQRSSTSWLQWRWEDRHRLWQLEWPAQTLPAGQRLQISSKKEEEQDSGMKELEMKVIKLDLKVICSLVQNIATGGFATPSPIRTVIAADFDNDKELEVFFNNIAYRGNAPNRLFRWD